MQVSTPPSPGGRFSSGLAFAAAGLIVAGLTAALYARVALTDAPRARVPLTVDSTPYAMQESYRREVSYLGMVVAGRKSALAFEIPGQISALSVREGSPVRAGQIIATLDDAALKARRDATAAEREQVESELELARLKADRQNDLRESGAVSREAQDETRLRAQALEAQLKVVAARLSGIDIELAKARLVAPYEGVIADRYLHEGTVVSPGAPVVMLVETAAQEVHVGVAAVRAANLTPGKSYSLKLRDVRFDATLLSVRPDVEPVTRTTTAVFALPPDIPAMDGESVTLILEETIDIAGGWLPLSALLEGRRGLWNVYRLESPGDESEDSSYRAVREAVEVLDLRDDRAYVRGTLADGALVVASGAHRIPPGAKVVLAAQP